jgi:hypothetical protein
MFTKGVDRIYQSATRSRTASVLQLHKSHDYYYVRPGSHLRNISLPSRDVQLVHLK